MTRSRRFSRKKGPVRSKKTKHDGIQFASGLEKHMYIALKKAKIKAHYEGQTYELVPSFNFEQEAYERQGNGKGEYRNRGNKKILNIKYTPDFVGDNFILNVKDVLMNLFPYVGSYLKLMYINTYRTLRYTNLKIKRNAKKP